MPFGVARHYDNRILDVADRVLNREDGRVRPFSEAVASEAGRMLGILAHYDPGAHHQLIAFALEMARAAPRTARSRGTRPMSFERP